MSLTALLNRVKKLEAEEDDDFDIQVPSPKYGDPVEYAVQRLKITSLTADQQTILRHLLIPPGRVLVPSGHNTGKTFVAAVAINWWYDTFDPGAVFTIGPRFDSLSDTIWGEVRLQRARAGINDDFIGPSAPHMRSAPDHWAKAFTASKDASLTGRHLPRMLFVIEEACGVDPIWWEVIMTMFDPSLGHAQLCIFNPTDTSSQAYQEDQNVADVAGNARWHRFRLSALNHPNVEAQLRGEAKPIRGAVSLEMLTDAVRDLCEPVEAAHRTATDVEWPPGSGKWHKPGPIFQARWLGVWPDTGAGVWSDALWAACTCPVAPAFPLRELPQIGCDTATGKGEDYFALHVRWGAVSVAHETANTMDPVRIYGRLKDAAGMAAALATAKRGPKASPCDPKAIAIKIDDDGVGNAVGKFLMRDGYAVRLVGAGTTANDSVRYPRRRDELWFAVADRARAGGVYLGGLDRATLRRLKQQLMAPTWDMDAHGRRCVEKKDDTKEKIGRSPDDADAMNLAFHEAVSLAPSVVEPEPSQRNGGHYARGR